MACGATHPSLAFINLTCSNSVRPERKYSVFGFVLPIQTGCNQPFSLIAELQWPATFAQPILSRVSIAACWLFTVMATTCSSKLINRHRTFPGLSADQQKVVVVFFFYLCCSSGGALIYLLEHLWEMGSEFDESHQKLSNQSCHHQSRSPLLLF